MNFKAMTQLEAEKKRNRKTECQARRRKREEANRHLSDEQKLNRIAQLEDMDPGDLSRGEAKELRWLRKQVRQ